MAAGRTKAAALAVPVFAKKIVLPSLPHEGIEVAVAVEVDEGRRGVPTSARPKGLVAGRTKAGVLAVPVFAKKIVLPS